MTRRPVTVAKGLGAWAQHEERPKKASRKRMSLGVAKASATRRMASGDWEEAGASELVALYAILHDAVYGVGALDVKSAAGYRAAVITGQRFVREEFSDMASAVEYVTWIWTREESREAWRREHNPSSTFRLSWRLLFTGAMLADYRLAEVRRRDRERKGT